MLTPKQYQEAFNMALEEFKNHPHVALSEGLNPYSPGSDDYRAWNDVMGVRQKFLCLHGQCKAYPG